MINHRLTIDYTLSAGWLAPWVEALSKGNALARHCSGCGRNSFAPERVCPCGETCGDWLLLSGKAVIENRTDGVDGSFALVRFKGADTCVVVALEGIAEGQTTGQLVRAEGALPRMVLGPAEENM